MEGACSKALASHLTSWSTSSVKRKHEHLDAKHVGVFEAKTHFSALIEHAIAGKITGRHEARPARQPASCRRTTRAKNAPVSP